MSAIEVSVLKRFATLKVSIFGVILVRIFLHLDHSTLRISPYSVEMRENTDQNNFKYGHFLRTANVSVVKLMVSITSSVSLWYRL